jgi:ABC-2 type transport system permease protein
MSDALLLARRNLAHVRQEPEKLLEATLQPLVFVLLFVYVFGSAIHVPGGSYREYLVPGILVQTLAFGIMGPATSIAADLQQGIVDRFRTLPMARSAFLTGHLLANLAASALAGAVMVATGLAVGWRVHTDAAHVATGFALLGCFSFAMLWCGMLLGVSVRSPEAVGGVAFTTVFPLAFLSNVFVPAGGLSTGLRQIAEYNPFSTVAAAVRELFGDPAAVPAHAAWPLQHAVLAAFAWCAVIAAVAAPLAVRRYRLRNRSS